MVDTARTQSVLLTQLFQDAQPNGAITAQDIRDFIVSINTLFELWNTPSYSTEAEAIAGGVPSHGLYRNGNIPQIRLT